MDFLNKLNQPFAASIDVTYRCNFNCKHCYFLKYTWANELNDNQLKALARYLSRKNILHVTWVGGEPLLRKNLLKELTPLFPYNWISTNGSIPLEPLSNTTYFVSIDGTEEYYSKIRNKKLFHKVKENVIVSASNGIKIIVRMTISRMNIRSLEDFLNEWSKTDITGINIDFYTPLSHKDPLQLNNKERDKTIYKISKLKKEYGDFLLITNTILELMLSKNMTKAVGPNCLVPKYVISIDPHGKIKKPCVMGKKAICNQCGCIVPYFLKALENGDIATVKMLTKTIKGPIQLIKTILEFNKQIILKLK